MSFEDCERSVLRVKSHYVQISLCLDGGVQLPSLSSFVDFLG